MINIVHFDTIAAQATPPGRGGIGVIRVSGPNTQAIASALLNIQLQPRVAHYASFKDQDGLIIDQGIAIFFPEPHSFTGEDVIEFQGHGGPVVMDRLLKRILQLGGRLARPGEFSERAFLNNKIDLTQAEAIADLINSASEQAARSAVRSLQGEFSRQIQLIIEQLIEVRMYVEAAIDFVEEEIDFLSDGKITRSLQTLLAQIATVRQQAKQGAVLREGLTVVLAGLPNAGKSTLLNCLSGEEIAIVTDIPGTTRDLMRQAINLKGIPLHIVDTAGLRESDDPIEQEGIKRAWQAIHQADCVLLIVDATQENLEQALEPSLLKELPKNVPILIVCNKLDLVKKVKPQAAADVPSPVNENYIYLSAKTGEGVDDLRHRLIQLAGFDLSTTEATFIARRRHLDALIKAEQLLQQGFEQFQKNVAGDLLAEDLRQIQQILGEITGEFTSDDLLGKIFSSFCIGK